MRVMVLPSRLSTRLREALAGRFGPQVGSMPPEVEEVLRSRFRLDAASMEGLRCAEKRSTYAGRPVLRFRVFDPSRVGGGAGSVRRYDDLNRYVDALLFEGYREPGNIQVHDRRRRGTTSG